MLDLLISALTALRDFLESLKSPPASAAAVAAAAPRAVIVPFLNYEVVFPAFIASRFGRRSLFAFVLLFVSALLVRIVQSLRHRRQQKENRLTYYQAGEGIERAGSSSPTATRPLPISTLEFVAGRAAAPPLLLRREGEENLLQGRDGKLYVAIQSQGFLQVWNADEQGRPVHRDPSSVEGEEQHVEECEQLLRHFSDREISASIARQPSESSSCFLLPPSPNEKRKE